EQAATAGFSDRQHDGWNHLPLRTGFIERNAGRIDLLLDREFGKLGFSRHRSAALSTSRPAALSTRTIHGFLVVHAQGTITNLNGALGRKVSVCGFPFHFPAAAFGKPHEIITDHDAYPGCSRHQWTAPRFDEFVPAEGAGSSPPVLPIDVLCLPAIQILR